MPEILEWRNVDRPDEVTQSIVQALASGAIVALPTETAYLATASATSAEAIARLKQLSAERFLEVMLPEASLPTEWLPSLTGPGLQLARRFWPGPLTLASGEGIREGRLRRLPESVQSAICSSGMLYLRQSGHEVMREVQRHSSEPLVGAVIAGEAGEAHSTRQVLDVVGSRIDWIVQGECRHFKPVTVIEVNGNDWQIRQEGVLSAEELRDGLACVVVFICTGNTCRSPMAEALCKKRLAERLGCRVDELSDRGYRVCSAGLAAGNGFPAADEAVEVAAAFGADLSEHESQPLTRDLADRADYLLVMTRGHERALIPHLPPDSNKLRLLSPQGDDVDDPIGGTREIYEACARQMEEYVEQFVNHLVP